MKNRSSGRHETPRIQRSSETLFQFEASKHRLQFIQGEPQKKTILEKLSPRCWRLREVSKLPWVHVLWGNHPRPGDGTVLRRLSQGDHSSNGYLQVSPWTLRRTGRIRIRRFFFNWKNNTNGGKESRTWWREFRSKPKIGRVATIQSIFLGGAHEFCSQNNMCVFGLQKVFLEERNQSKSKSFESVLIG